MHVSRLAALLALTLAACGPTAPAPAAGQSSSLAPAHKAAIGRKIWQNECGGTVDGLTSWNGGENFPSLGIGHFIWYPAGVSGPFDESWPRFAAYAAQRGTPVPPIGRQADAPWANRAAFQAAFRRPDLNQLRQWLAGHVELQTDFIIARSRASLPKILQAATPADRPRIERNYQKVATTANGQYALIDYVNFKGEGTHPGERYQGQGWGLLQVLAGMAEVPSGQPAAAEFAASAKRVLGRRIAQAPAERGEGRWKAGWFNRCDTYARPL
ncbi:hypothetical protein HNR46_000208 [Haloferula luteola]|uniref:Uncharacterized protein n=1 Tax=Haloferula luteola TaxID=595692 RepID=A0A840UUW2_9BACT|nr:hypothetical protein [Haloferula luteola]MBB5349987.1 hypothetical protein [Haloferula luteola]